MLAIQALKKALGVAGQSDFETRGPGDLSWPLERICVFVNGCTAYGCPEHTKNVTVFWQKKARANRARAARMDKKLEDQDWRVLRYMECEVDRATDRVVAEIVQAFSEIHKEQGSDAPMAVKVANIDGALRVGEDDWMRFLKLISELGLAFRRADVMNVLLDREGWFPDTLKYAWRTALHHRVIRWDNAGVHPDILLLPCLKDLGLIRQGATRKLSKKEKENVRVH